MATLLASCSTGTATPVSPTSTVAVIPSATTAPSATPRPSETPKPEVTAEPTVTLQPTAYPPLQTDGPYLAYLKSEGDQQSVVLLDADGAGRKIIPLPDGAFVRDIENAISPDGQWLAFNAGTYEPPYDLSLNLLHISDGEIHQVARLLSEDFPENFVELGKQLPSFDAGLFSAETNWTQLAEWSFAPGIFAVSWSPNSKQLAFAAQMDGPSSDLYLYDIERKVTQRLTNEILNVGRISWSPTGQYIVFGNVIPGMNYFGTVVNALASNSSWRKRLTEVGGQPGDAGLLQIHTLCMTKSPELGHPIFVS